MLDAVAAGGRAGGCLVLRAGGSELERALPFGVASGLLEDWLSRADEDVRGDVLSGAAVGAAPMLLGEGAPADGGGLAAQMALVHALHRVVANIAERGPLVLIVDDLHWVDEPSLRLVGYLARRVADLGVLLAVALRPAEPRAPQAVLHTVLSAPGARLLEPAPLSPAATAAVVEELLPTTPNPAFTAACTEVTGGNPLLLGELVRALVEDGARGTKDDAVRVHDIGPEPVVWTVRSMLGHLPEAAGHLARAVCVLGPGADLDAAQRVAGLDPETARSSIADLERTGFLADDGRLEVTHPLLRRAALVDVSAPQLRRLHRRAARERALRGEAARAGAHLLDTTPGGQAWAVEALLDAAEQASLRASPAEAARLLDRALEEPPRPAQEARVLRAAARAKAAAGLPDAAATFAAAVAAAPAADAPALLLELAWTHQAHGRFADAAEASMEGLTLGPEDREVALELEAMRDAALLWSPGPAPTPRRMSSADGPAEGRAARVVLADAARRGMFAGDDHLATADFARRAWDGGALVADSSSDDPAAVRVLAALLSADLLAEATAVADACLDDARRRASPMAHATWRHLRGHVLAHAGALEEAEADLRQALAAHEYGWGAFLPVTAAVLVTVLLERGDPAGARAALELAEATSTHPPESPMWATTQAARGRLALAEGDPGAAAEDLLAAGRRGTVELAAYNPALGPWRADAVLALHRVGRGPEALALGDEELAAARRFGAPKPLAAALRVRATAGPASERRQLLLEAVAVAAPSEARIEYAHALLALGTDQRATSDPAARDTLRLALDVSDRCQADGLAARARTELLATGARPRRRRLAGPEALTVGERRAAELARDGLSNRAIADELFVTPKAVAFHLGNAYRKLGVAGRRQLGEVL
jgi:DNA-binding CsgD family transcriptional regulator